MKILRGSRRFGRCRSCQAPIEWAKVVDSGRMMPFNAPIVVLLPLPDLDDDVVCIDMTQTTSHFATCPDAERWRKKAKA